MAGARVGAPGDKGNLAPHCRVGNRRLHYQPVCRPTFIPDYRPKEIAQKLYAKV